MTRVLWFLNERYYVQCSPQLQHICMPELSWSPLIIAAPAMPVTPLQLRGFFSDCHDIAPALPPIMMRSNYQPASPIIIVSGNCVAYHYTIAAVEP